MSKILSPPEMGLSEKFDSWRPSQESALDVIFTSQKRVTTLSMPTGSGKSPVYMAAAKAISQRACIVTNSRGLQDQLMADFAPMGLVDIRGRRNYQCDLKPDYTCEDGYQVRCPYKGTVGCPSSLAEIRAARSPLVVTNYDKWTSSKKFGLGMENFDLVIFDEAHEMPNALARAMQVILHHKEIEEELGLPFLLPKDAMEFANWKPWAYGAKAVAEAQYTIAQARITGVSDPKASWVKKVSHMRNLVKRLSTIATASSKEWIVDEVEQGYQFDPIRPGRYAESGLLFKVPRILATSATIRPKTMYMCNLGKDTFDFKEFDSDFDPARCPVYWIPTMRVDRHTADDLSMLWLRHDQIATRRQDRNALVHTISYTRRDDILRHSRFASNMLINQKGEATTSMIETFSNSEPPTELVSPSVGTGYDFPMAKAEWQFICKIPFQDGRSKIVKARQAEDKEYGPYIATQDLVQIIGRLMRSKEDRGETFLPDDHIEWFLPRYSHLFPRSFHGNFKRISTIPPAPPKL